MAPPGVPLDRAPGPSSACSPTVVSGEDTSASKSSTSLTPAPVSAPDSWCRLWGVVPWCLGHLTDTDLTWPTPVSSRVRLRVLSRRWGVEGHVLSSVRYPTGG